MNELSFIFGKLIWLGIEVKLFFGVLKTKRAQVAQKRDDFGGEDFVFHAKARSIKKYFR